MTSLRDEAGGRQNDIRLNLKPGPIVRMPSLKDMELPEHLGSYPKGRKITD